MKKQIFFITLSVSLILPFVSCKKEIEDESLFDHTLKTEEIAEINDNFCTTHTEHDYNDRNADSLGSGVEDRGTGMKGRFWPAGKVLRVRFMNGSSSLRTKVFNYAKTWSNHANIKFSLVNSGTSDIRVRFGTSGNNSFIGTDNATISQSVQTMNLQLNDDSHETKIRSVVLHEFGHALGLNHEHLSPVSNIPWNKPNVYSFYAQQEGWSKSTVDVNVLNKLTWESSQFTNFDSKSIMIYPIPSLLTINGFFIPMSTELSAMDKEFIGKMYSANRIRVRHAANISGTISIYLNGVYSTLKKGEVLYVPAQTTGNVLQIWECPSTCKWSSFYPSYGKQYKIVSVSGNANDLKLVQE